MRKANAKKKRVWKSLNRKIFNFLIIFRIVKSI